MATGKLARKSFNMANTVAQWSGFRPNRFNFLPMKVVFSHRLQAVDMSLVLDMREILVQGVLLVERWPRS